MRSYFHDLSRRVDSIKFREANIHQDYIGLEFRCFAHCFPSAGRFPNYFQIFALVEQGGNQVTMSSKILNGKNPRDPGCRRIGTVNNRICP